jgi:hypothetical protein
VAFKNEGSKLMKVMVNHPQFKRVSQFLFSAASLVAGVLVAVLIQAVLSSVTDNF